MSSDRAKLPPLTPGMVKALLNDGYSQSEIGRLSERTRQRISAIVREHNIRDESPREKAAKEFPFNVLSIHQSASVYKRLRDHGEYYFTKGVGMREDKLSRLRGFYRRLNSLVVEYDPNILPIPGVSTNGGWAYRSRETSDSNLLIRINDYTKLTEEGFNIWRLPDQEP